MQFKVQYTETFVFSYKYYHVLISMAPKHRAEGPIPNRDNRTTYSEHRPRYHTENT